MDALNAAKWRGRELRRRAHRPLSQQLRRHAREADRASRRHRLDRHRHSRAGEWRVGFARVARPHEGRRRRRRRAKPRRSPRRIAMPGAAPRACSRRAAVPERDAGRAPYKIDPFTIPIEQKAQLLIDANTEAMKVANVKFVNSNMFFMKEDRNYANTDGSFITQTVIRSWVPFTATAVAPDFSDFQIARQRHAAGGRGWEYITRRRSSSATRGSGAKRRRRSSRRSRSKSAATISCCTRSHLWLTIHESIAHPTELDRAMGYEANYAGTSFVAPPEKVLGKLKYGPEFMNIQGDRTQEGGCATIGWDDDGVKPEIVPHHQERHRSTTIRRAASRRRGSTGGTRRSEAAGASRTAAATPTTGAACSSSACRTSRCCPASKDRRVGRPHRGDRQRHRDHRRRLVLDRPAALQRAVRRPGVLRDQGRQDHRHAERRRVSDETPDSGTRWT